MRENRISTRIPTSDKPSCGIRKKSGARRAIRVKKAKIANGPIAESFLAGRLHLQSKAHRIERFHMDRRQKPLSCD